MKLILIVTSWLPLVKAFVLPTASHQAATLMNGSQRLVATTPIHRLQLAAQNEGDSCCSSSSNNNKVAPTDPTMQLKQWAGAASLGAALMLTTMSPTTSAFAYDASDYASETVQSTIKALKDTAGNAEETYKVYEEMNSIITEGKGVGGAINYKGVQLDRGYVADEDTSIYNPGLTLLTESEKERLVEAIVANRKLALQKGDWPELNQSAFEFLREKLDPFHVAELRGYLQILPFYAAAVYLAVLAVQQFVRDFFPAAYIVGVVAIFAPALFLVALGPS